MVCEETFDVKSFVKNILNTAIKKDKKREYQKSYRKQNKKLLEIRKIKNEARNKQFGKSRQLNPENRMNKKISGWKNQGIITDDYKALYNHYIKTSFCDFCRVKLTIDRFTKSTTKVVDHDHMITNAPNFRNILCSSCNVSRR